MADVAVVEEEEEEEEVEGGRFQLYYILYLEVLLLVS